MGKHVTIGTNVLVKYWYPHGKSKINTDIKNELNFKILL